MLLYSSFLKNLAFSLNLNPRSLLTQCHCSRMSKFKYYLTLVFSLSRNPLVSLQEVQWCHSRFQVQLLLSKISAARHCTSVKSFLFYLMVTSLLLLCFIYLFPFLFTLNNGGKGCLLKLNSLSTDIQALKQWNTCREDRNIEIIDDDMSSMKTLCISFTASLKTVRFSLSRGWYSLCYIIKDSPLRWLYFYAVKKFNVGSMLEVSKRTYICESIRRELVQVTEELGILPLYFSLVLCNKVSCYPSPN